VRLYLQLATVRHSQGRAQVQTAEKTFVNSEGRLRSNVQRYSGAIIARQLDRECHLGSFPSNRPKSYTDRGESRYTFPKKKNVRKL